MMETMNHIKKEKLISIIRLDDNNNMQEIIKSLYNGGIRIIEVTMNTPGALEAIKEIKETYGDLYVGAGTVLDEASARMAILAGADFLLAPTLREETIRTGNRYNIPVIPGVMTPTEALQAYEYGAQMVKVFPVRKLGADYAKDLKGPLPFLDVMAVGGIVVDNANEYLEKGWDSLGIGSSLVNQKLVSKGEFKEIENRARKFIEARDKA